jgi:hypothetical protein
LKLTLTKAAAGSLSLPHRAGKFVFDPVCSDEIPDLKAKAMLKTSPGLYVEAIDANVKDSLHAAKDNRKLNPAQVLAAAKQKELNAEFEKGVLEGKKEIAEELASTKELLEKAYAEIKKLKGK